ncbi:glycosyltransferase [Chromobacterium phragmitis]|uniref:Glycosyl transferase n=1 Tax=Chromobacterium phragmitis TaxID=2202141 RepID=A0A344UKN8_9NEIS|nr:glycosyltransferase [Chromobacterium phragmitis]AXE35836.1 glycosyl transferase [Chromobacterium phragmitis]
MAFKEIVLTVHGSTSPAFAAEKGRRSRLPQDPLCGVSGHRTKVLHLGKHYHPDQGGIETVTQNIAEGAARAGCDVAVLCFGDVERLSRERVGDVEVLRAPIWRKAASQPIGWQYFRAFLRCAREYDIVHAHAPNMLAALAVVLARVPSRLVVHWHSDVVNKGWLGRMMHPLEWLMLRRADAVIATSQAYADASPLLRRFRDKVRVVPIGIEDPKLVDNRSVSAPALAQACGYAGQPAEESHDDRIVLAIGRLVPYKGFEVLVEAARELPPGCRIVIVGGGEGRAELESRIARYGVGDKVQLAGRLDDGSLRSLFQRATLFCLPSVSRAEAFGVVLLEAMAHGLPIIASDITGSGVPWVNSHEETGLNVPVGDARALAAAITSLLAEPERLERMRAAARRRFEAEFTAETATRRVLELYAALAPPQCGNVVA